jgi:hypothetical protein
MLFRGLRAVRRGGASLPHTHEAQQVLVGYASSSSLSLSSHSNATLGSSSSSSLPLALSRGFTSNASPYTADPEMTIEVPPTPEPETIPAEKVALYDTRTLPK